MHFPEFLTDENGEIVLRKNGTPILIIAGAAEDDGEDPNGGEGGDPGENPPPPPDDKKPARRIADETDPAALQAEIKRLRNESRGYRESTATKAQEAAEKARKDMLEELQVKLGLKKGDDAPTVESLQKQFQADLAARDGEIKTLKLKGALTEAMSAAGARPVARDAIVGSGILNSIDPASDTFVDDMAEKVEEYLTKHPELKAEAPKEPPNGKSGGDQGGGNKDNNGPKSIDDLRKERAARRATNGH
jgi:hypothetical protein